jgi:hypothetical protein
MGNTSENYKPHQRERSSITRRTAKFIGLAVFLSITGLLMIIIVSIASLIYTLLFTWHDPPVVIHVWSGVVGVAAGIIAWEMMGKVFEYKGSVLTGILGSVLIGVCASVVVLLGFREAWLLAYIPLSALTGTIGYHLKRTKSNHFNYERLDLSGI